MTANAIYNRGIELGFKDEVRLYANRTAIKTLCSILYRFCQKDMILREKIDGIYCFYLKNFKYRSYK